MMNRISEGKNDRQKQGAAHGWEKGFLMGVTKAGIHAEVYIQSDSSPLFMCFV